MINQQLLYFIKQQLQQGETKEKISSYLLANNWTTQDIEEGFNAINVTNSNPLKNPISTIQVKNHPGRKIFAILIVLFVLVGGVSGYYFRNDIPIIKDLIRSKTSPVDEINIVQPESQQNQDIVLPNSPTPSSEQVTSNENDIVTTTETVEGGDSIIKIKAEVETTVNCGSEDCFKKKFTACQPATMISDAGFAAVSYKIIEPTTSGCKMTFKYTTNPNPDWVNKEMTCTFDNKIGFDESIKKVFDGIFDGTVVCAGPLYPVMRSAMDD